MHVSRYLSCVKRINTWKYIAEDAVEFIKAHVFYLRKRQGKITTQLVSTVKKRLKNKTPIFRRKNCNFLLIVYIYFSREETDVTDPLQYEYFVLESNKEIIWISDQIKRASYLIITAPCSTHGLNCIRLWNENLRERSQRYLCHRDVHQRQSSKVKSSEGGIARFNPGVEKSFECFPRDLGLVGEPEYS